MSSSAASEAAMRGCLHPRSPALAADVGWRQPFTAAQWRELEQQALIFKYLIAGVPVPPDLLLPIQRSFEALPSRFYHHYPALGCVSYYGKKLDPEPGRCRRTDGKKWRCSKDVHPDSKYCERHMHRSRNRSRKHVEAKTNLSQQQSQSHLSSSTATSDATLGSTGSLQNITLKSSMSVVNKPQDLCSDTSGAANRLLDPQLFRMGCKGYLHGARIEVDEHNFFSQYPGSKQTDLQANSSLDSSLGLMPSQLLSFPISKSKTSLQYSHYSSHLHELQDLNEITNLSLPKQQEQQHSYFRSDFCTSTPGKQECQGLQPLFYDWPKARESWLDLEDEQSEQNSFSATQLSISIPMASSDFSTTTCCSPNDD